MTFEARSVRRKGNLAAQFRAAVRGAGVAAALLTGTLLGPGCSRQNYRCKTDTEAYYLLDEKRAESCETDAPAIRIELDPRSRMFDPFNPDRPPMPEDDPQSNRYMRCVDGKKGYPLWEGNGRTNVVENPEWWNFLPLDERGVLVLDLESAVRTALLHSPDYQSALEQMYLSALDVSSERFLLDSQFFGGWNTGFRRDGPERSLGAPFGQTVVTTGADSRGRRPFSMQKQFATGADLVVGFANSLTWQLAGPDNTSGLGILDFSLIQPLLRQGGRDVVLERLTLAERTLLANVRAFERYRRGFYIDIATGRGPDTRPQRRGGAFGGSGLGGFDVLGSVFSNAGGGGGFGGGGVPGAGGYLGILQSQLQIANQQEQIVRLQDLYLQLEDNYRELLLTMPESQTEIPSQQVQVAQAKQSVYDAQTNLLQLQAGYESDLDSFKATLGLPPYLCVEITGSLLDQFKLISQDLRDRRTDIAMLRASVGQNNSQILGLTKIERDEETGELYRVMPDTGELRSSLQAVGEQVAPLGGLLQMVLDQDVEQVRADIEVLRQNVPKRRQQLNRLKDIAERERGMVCSLLPLGDFNTTFLDGEGLEELPDQLTVELDRLLEKLEGHEESFDEVTEAISRISGGSEEFDSERDRYDEISEFVILGTQDLIAEINESVLAVQLVQARARTEAALLPEVDIEPREALEIARQNRRDWLNNRANLVNTWRAIEVVADDLESFLDLEVSGDIRTAPGASNPLALRTGAGTLNVGLSWDAPITRLQERNNYRSVLIQYQQAKRSYYQYEDSVWTTMRSTLRQVRQNQLSFEIQRFAVQNAGLQISVNEDIRQINETLGQAAGPTAARDAVQGLQAFLGTQSQLIGVFINYEAIRRSLDLDLGTMELDSEGLWIDPGPIRTDTVGGGLGNAIMEYGLTEGEMLLRDRIEVLDDQPIEIAPTDAMPPVSPSPDFGSGLDPVIGNPVIGAPVSSPALNSGAFMLPAYQTAAPNMMTDGTPTLNQVAAQLQSAQLQAPQSQLPQSVSPQSQAGNKVQLASTTGSVTAPPATALDRKSSPAAVFGNRLFVRSRYAQNVNGVSRSNLNADRAAKKNRQVLVRDLPQLPQ